MEYYDAKVDEAFEQLKDAAIKQLSMQGVPCSIRVVDGARTICIDDIDKLWTQVRKEYKQENQ